MPGARGENRCWAVMTAPEGSKEPGINGGIVARKTPKPKGGEPVSAFICTVQVSSVDDYLNKVVNPGGQVALPKMPIPGLAWLAAKKS